MPTLISQSTYKFICIASLLSLLHCAYSAAQHRFYLRLIEEPFTRLPIDIVLQTLVSLIVLVYSASYVAGEFRPIRGDHLSSKKSWDTVGNCPSFYSFEHRGKTLSPAYSAFPHHLRKQRRPQLDRLSKPSDGLKSIRNSPPPSKDQALDSFKLCIGSVKKHDFSNYVAALLMPREVQPHVFALLAFNVELTLVRDHIERNAGTAGIFRLQFWRDAISAIYGCTSGPIPRQPVATALRLFGSQADIEPLYGLVEARQQTLGDRPFESVAALESYAEKTSGALHLMVMNALARKTNEVVSLEMKEAALAMGKSVGVLNHLRSTVPLLKRGIVILPTDVMTIHGLSADNVYTKQSPEGIRNLARDLTTVSDKWLQESRRHSLAVSKSTSLALISSGASVDHMLKTMKKTDYDLFDARLQRGHPLLAWMLMWRKLRGYY
ncbi:hypothetical protein QR680_018840 [Steinernema hermaphroditum]|uniref:NADH dehydrogenase (Ubiquinone) complex I, assembly factor 6 n=1 Tax=Steinernema hermaphroditum TaxID=289476 RepID=A0AA39HK50_9BILA|nr:hypothetical protein QR680_018840 [Steinernema hermaphroditum]